MGEERYFLQAVMITLCPRLTGGEVMMAFTS